MPLFAGFDPMEMTILKNSIMNFYSKCHVYDALRIIWEDWANELSPGDRTIFGGDMLNLVFISYLSKK